MLVGHKVARKGQKKWRRVFVAFLLLALLWFISWLGARWLIVNAPLEHADAIVVLSGSSTLSERVQHAAHLYSQKRAPKILLTTDDHQGGWSTEEQRNPYFYEFAFKELMRLGVPSQNIEVVRPPVSNTWDEAVRIGEYSKTHNLRSVLIVTSSYHSRRALWTFRTLFDGTDTQVGIDPVTTGIQTPPPATWWLHARGWQLVAVEYLKLIYYRGRGL
ncbi:MAG TPA: YdcF family protein [Pyrinomonadaceae bacterium]|nr:YdcF family protein [Pyrinomonadaceae bacterium]